MSRPLPFVWLLAPLALSAACSSSSSPARSPGGGDAGTEAGAAPEAGADAAHPPKLDHLVVIIQENHTFDIYFGRWCTASTGSNPTCTQGPTCCDAGPG